MAREREDMSSSTGISVPANGCLSVKDFSEWADTPLPTLRNWIRLRQIAFYQPAGPGGKIYIPIDALERFAPPPEPETDRGNIAPGPRPGIPSFGMEPETDAGPPDGMRPRRGPRPKWRRK